MRVAIIENEKIHQDYLLTMFEEAASRLNTPIVYRMFESAESFLFHFEDEKIDALFIDIMLGGMNGFKLAEKVREIDWKIPLAFITGEKDYVFDGYRVDAFGYLLKPITQDQITNLLDKLVKKLENVSPSLLVKTKDGLVNVYEDDILYIESNNHTSILKTKGNEYLTSEKMSDWRSRLSETSFFLTHRSYLVNLKHISRIDKKLLMVDDEVAIPIARGKWQQLMEAYMKYKRKDY